LSQRVIENSELKAVVGRQVVAESNDIVEAHCYPNIGYPNIGYPSIGHQYFPAMAVRRDWLEKTARTTTDQACPHRVQFYDVVVAGTRQPRTAWSCEAPRPEMKAVGGRFGFWQDVEVA
jgi:uncharacterized protein (DUF427 family)